MLKVTVRHHWFAYRRFRVWVCFQSGVGFSCPFCTIQILFWVNDGTLLPSRTRPLTLSLQFCPSQIKSAAVDSSWSVMAHGDARKGKWRGNWRMEWVASTLHTTSKHDVYSITTTDAHTSTASSRLNWRPRRFKWTRPFRRKTKSGFCACAITFQPAFTYSAFEMYRFRSRVLLMFWE